MRPLLLLSLTACATTSSVTVPTTPALSGRADTHLHLTMSAAAKPFMKGEPGSGPLTSTTSERLINGVSAEDLHATGVTLVFGALWPPLRLRPGRSALDEALHQVRELDAFMGRQPAFALASNSQDARRILSTGRIAVVAQLEGGEGIARVEDVDALYAAGVRVITVVHFVSTQLGGAAKGQLSRALLGAAADGALEAEGLSALGREVVSRMVQLGMVIDVAHASDRFVSDVLDVTEPLGVPVLVSHTAARALSNVERNLSDVLARRVAASGGLIGVTLSRVQLETDAGHRRGAQHQPGTCDDLVAHWRHLASVASADTLVLGSDVNGFITRPSPGGLCPDGVRNYGDLNQVWAALETSGIPSAALDGMADKLLGLLERVESRADESAQAQARRRYARVRDERSVLDVP
ncbi:MAG: membrane dipeptidase [Archangium sp.]|nr:membrane dipeptidase [Archangium sp.]